MRDHCKCTCTITQSSPEKLEVIKA